jgi:hypothetical protein
MADEVTQEERELQEAQLKISNRISGVFLGLIGVLSLLAAVAYVGFSDNIGSQPVAAAPAAQTVTVAMHDPGCHWFQVGQGFQKSLSIAGPVKLLNSDEAALKVAGSNGVQTDAVGQRVALTPGSYRITMVGQAPDDNTLHLSVS